MALLVRKLRFLVVLLAFLGFLALEVLLLALLLLGLGSRPSGLLLYLGLPLVFVSLLAGLKAHLALFRRLRA